MRSKLIRTSLLAVSLGSLAFAQSQSPYPADQQSQGQNLPPIQPPSAPASSSSDGTWHKFGDGQSQPDPRSAPDSQQQPSSNNGAYNNNGAYQGNPNQGNPNQGNPNQGNPGYSGGYSSTAPAPRYQPPVPANLTIPSGTWLTIRTTNPISTEHNQAGDAFSAVLTEPVVVNGIVVARKGQTLQGRVASAEKAGRVSGVSKLGLELTDLILVDGQQVPVHTQMVQRNGNTSFGRDAAAIGTTTAAGAAIGAGVNGGVGAGVGAGAGLVVSTLGVLLTRGRPAVVYPETVLTFRVQDAVTISTVNSAGAFRSVNPQDYENNPRRLTSSTPQRPGYGPAGYGPGYGYATPYPYYAPYYGYGYGPGVYLGFGRGYGYRRW